VLSAHFAYLGDAERLYQLVVNLGANAIRFTPRGGRVVVRVVDAGAEVELQVEDTGVGIPATALPTIFDPYRQAHRNRGGSGRLREFKAGITARLAAGEVDSARRGVGQGETITA